MFIISLKLQQAHIFLFGRHFLHESTTEKSILHQFWSLRSSFHPIPIHGIGLVIENERNIYIYIYIYIYIDIYIYIYIYI